MNNLPDWMTGAERDNTVSPDPRRANQITMRAINEEDDQNYVGRVSAALRRAARIETYQKFKEEEGSVFVPPGMEKEAPQQQDHAMAFAREHAAKHALPQPGESTLPSSGPRWIRGANSLTPKLDKMSAGICAEQRPNYRIEHPVFPHMLPKD